MGVNAHRLVGNIRNIWWNQLTEKEPIELELIDYYKSDSYKFRRGEYQVYYAIAVADYPDLAILKGDELIIHISLASYCIAIRELKSEIITPCIEEFGKGKNLYIKLSKKNKRAVKIHTQSLREPTELQLKNAEIQYGWLKNIYGKKEKEVKNNGKQNN